MPYIFPKGEISSSVTTLISRSRVPYIDPGRLADLYKEEVHPNSLLQLDLDQVSLLTRYPQQLMDQDLVVVTNVPGLVYKSDWMMTAASLPRIDWIELEGRLAKSGLTAYNPADTRSHSALTHSGPLHLPDDDPDDAADVGSEI